jgi:hypothetical protein
VALRQGGLEDVLLHLPSSLRDRAEEMASRECLSLNLFLVMAVAEKLQRLQIEHALECTQDGDAAPTSDRSWADLVH